MADPPEKNRLIDGCASSKGSGIFDCLLLPLFSLCSRRNVAGQAQAESIDKQPGCADHSESSGDYAPTFFESIGMDGWNDSDEISERTESGFLDEAITEEEPEPDRVKLNDLPLLPLLVICGFLRTDGCCKDLDSFRKTCRAFAFAANTFLENPANLPVIDILCLHFKERYKYPKIEGRLPLYNYFIHPIRYGDGDDYDNDNHLFNFDWNWRDFSFSESLATDTEYFTFESLKKYRNTDAITRSQKQLIPEILRGPVDKLGLMFWEDDDNDIKMASEILQNIVSYNMLFVRADAFNGVVRSFILELLRKRASLAEGIVVADIMHFGDATDADLFLTALDSMMNHVLLMQDDEMQDDEDDDEDEELFFGFPTGFWYQWLLRKIREGYNVRFNSSIPSVSPESLEPLTSDDYEIYEIEWCKV